MSAPDKELLESYRAVGTRAFQMSDLQAQELEISRRLFELESLEAKTPRPRQLEVVALVAGLPFPNEVLKPLVKIQQDLGQILSGSLYYWVKPQNLAVECCVLKWPDDPPLDVAAKLTFAGIRYLLPSVFTLRVHGVQLHRDGCIVARGFDEHGAFRQTRARMLQEYTWMPSRQSSWAHIPLGRILEPLGQPKFSALKGALQHLEEQMICHGRIDQLKLVHEHQWYMERRSTLMSFNLIEEA